jgi:hypothetical protein
VQAAAAGAAATREAYLLSRPPRPSHSPPLQPQVCPCSSCRQRQPACLRMLGCRCLQRPCHTRCHCSPGAPSLPAPTTASARLLRPVGRVQGASRPPCTQQQPSLSLLLPPLPPCCRRNRPLWRRRLQPLLVRHLWIQRKRAGLGHQRAGRAGRSQRCAAACSSSPRPARPAVVRRRPAPVRAAAGASAAARPAAQLTRAVHAPQAATGAACRCWRSR